MSSALNLHVWGNLTLGALYGLLFIFVVRDTLIPYGIKKPASVGVMTLFSLLTAGLLTRAFFSSPEAGPAEMIWLAAAGTPVLICFFLAARNGFKFNFTEDKTSRERFEKLKEEFISVASHELRTPLSVISGFAEILAREKLGPLNDEQRLRVQKILAQGQRLNRIVDELLDLTRIKQGKLAVRKEVFDLVPVLKACVDDHQIVCDQQTLELIDAVPEALPRVTGDVERITQVTVNLLSNAIKYTDPGGKVRVEARYDSPAQEVVVSVCDTGLGFAPQQMPHLFREFYRVHHPGKKHSGTGLGLAIVKHLVEAQGGRVGVTSPGQGKGSCFFFTLPSQESAEAYRI